MHKHARYTREDIDLDMLLPLSKLELSQSERDSFLADMCDMANYTYDKLSCESAEGALATAKRGQKMLFELREDVAEICEYPGELLALAPTREKDMISVPRAVGAKEGE